MLEQNLSDKNNLVNDSIIIEKDNKIKNLVYENNYLREEIKKLSEENKFLEYKNKKEMFIINNKYKYEEILENVKYLNTRITQQFFETNYDQYVLV